MQGQWHTPRPKVLSMPHRMLLEMVTTSGLHTLYIWLSQNTSRAVLYATWLETNSQKLVLQRVLHNIT